MPWNVCAHAVVHASPSWSDSSSACAHALSAHAWSAWLIARERLGGFQVPRSVEFVASLPRTTSGKVLKRVLREPYWSEHARRVGEA